MLNVKPGVCYQYLSVNISNTELVKFPFFKACEQKCVKFLKHLCVKLDKLRFSPSYNCFVTFHAAHT